MDADGDNQRALEPRTNRLPSFTEVLARRTRPPVDLFNFYLFLQREGAEDILDFWLDVQQHENLCRAYFKDVRKSGRSIKEDWPEYWDYARRRGSIYGTVVGAGMKRSTQSAEDTGEKATRSPTPPAQGRSDTPWSLKGRLSSSLGKRMSRAPTIIPRSAAITRNDLVASAERIYFRYLAPASATAKDNHEIYLPPSLRIHTFPLADRSNEDKLTTSEENARAQIPDMFHLQKEYVFRAMEQDAYPRFLRSKAFGNLTPVSALVRLILGLVVLWIALATAFALVFLDVKPKSKRFFLFIPFTLALALLLSHAYELDPLLVFFGQSETTPFRTMTVHEPYVRKLLVGRAVWVTVLVAVGTTALTLLFWAVPGHRL